MSRGTWMVPAGALAAAGLFCGAAAWADPPGGRGAVGLKLIIIDKYLATNKAKFVYVSKDSNPGAIHKGVSADPPNLNGMVEVFPVVDPSNRLVFDLHDSGDSLTGTWLVNKPTVAKYVNKGASPGDRGAKVVVIKPDKVLKVVGKNLGDGDDDSGNQSATDLDASTIGIGETVRVIVTIDNTGNLPPDTHVMCSDFEIQSVKAIAGGTGYKIVSKSSTAPADGTCAAGSVGGAFLSFVTGPAGGTCGAVKQGGSGGTTVKSLTCGGLNIGGGASTVAEGPTPAGAETQFKITGGPTNWTVGAATSGDTGSNNNCSDTGCQFGTYLPISNAGTSTCVRNTFASPASGSINTSTGNFIGAAPLDSEVFLTANGTDPCPRCIAGSCQAGWTSGVGPSPTENAPCTATDGAGDTYDCVPPAGASIGIISVPLNPLTTGQASNTDPAGLFCPGQANAGAFGCLGSGAANPICPGGNSGGAPNWIEENGVPAGTVDTTPAPGTLASVFCIPSVGPPLGFLVNGAANLPGPGATSLPGTLAILP